MQGLSEPWDYLIVTASNDAQAAAYERQLALRRELGMLAGVRAMTMGTFEQRLKSCLEPTIVPAASLGDLSRAIGRRRLLTV